MYVLSTKGTVNLLIYSLPTFSSHSCPSSPSRGGDQFRAPRVNVKASREGRYGHTHAHTHTHKVESDARSAGYYATARTEQIRKYGRAAIFQHSFIFAFLVSPSVISFLSPAAPVIAGRNVSKHTHTHAHTSRAPRQRRGLRRAAATRTPRNARCLPLHRGYALCIIYLGSGSTLNASRKCMGPGRV